MSDILADIFYYIIYFFIGYLGIFFTFGGVFFFCDFFVVAEFYFRSQCRFYFKFQRAPQSHFGDIYFRPADSVDFMFFQNIWILFGEGHFSRFFQKFHFSDFGGYQRFGSIAFSKAGKFYGFSEFFQSFFSHYRHFFGNNFAEYFYFPLRQGSNFYIFIIHGTHIKIN